MKKLKLKHILQHFDSLENIVVSTYNYTLKNDDEIFKGYAIDCPWSIVELYLDTNDLGEALSLGKDEEGNAYLKIYVLEQD